MKYLFALALIFALSAAQSVDYVPVQPASNVSIPTPRYWSTCMFYNNSIIVFGGDIDTSVNNLGMYQSDLHVFDVATGTWTLGVSNTYPLVNTNGATVIINGVAYVWGGSTSGDPANAPGNRLEVFTTYNFATATWGQAPTTAVAPFNTLPRSLASAVETPNGGIAVFGGSQGVGAFFQDFYEFNVTSQTFTNLNPATGDIPLNRSGHSVTVYNGKMYLFGGRNASSVYNDLWSYDFNAGVWTNLNYSGTPPAARFGQVGIRTSDGNWIIYGGGSASDNSQYSDTFYLNLNNLTWSSPSITHNPGSRVYHCAVQNGDTMYVFGGANNTYTYGDIQSFAYVAPVQTTTAATSAGTSAATSGQNNSTMMASSAGSTTLATSNSATNTPATTHSEGSKFTLFAGLAVLALTLFC